MDDEATDRTLATWCALPPVAAHPGPDLFSEVNASWQAAHPNAPASLLQALAKDEERRLTVLVDRQVGDGAHRGPATRPARVSSAMERLHRVFVTDHDPAAERAACRPELSVVASAGTDTELLTVLAGLTRGGYASPLHLGVRATRDAGAVVVPAIHAAPLPPADFHDDERVAGYVRHMSAMVGHIGGELPDERFAGVVALDRALWCDPPADDPPAEFPWTEFLEQAIGPRRRPWSSRIPAATRRRAAAWWCGPLAARRDWMTSRLAYDLGPFASEEALVRNSRFFAGRVLGVTDPRPRPARFVSFAKTVAPTSLARLYIEDRRDPATLERAHAVVEALRTEAVAWAARSEREHGAWEGTRLLRDLVVELGHRPGTAAGGGGAEPGDAPSVCHAIRSARREAIDGRLSAIDDPRRDEEWRIQPYTAAAYYQGSVNKVVVPWALLREPVIGPDLPDVQVHALFGTLVAHEMAHAVLPGSTGDWDAFVARTSLGGLLDRFAASTRARPGHEHRPSHERELAADAIGFLWAHRAFVGATDRPGPEFLRYWATRWRGAPAATRAGFGHLDHHPPADLRCDLAPTYAQELQEDDPAMAGGGAGTVGRRGGTGDELAG